MNIAEMKVEMFEILTQTQSEDKLARIYEKMQEVIEAPEDDWWDDLTVEQQIALRNPSKRAKKRAT